MPGMPPGMAAMMGGMSPGAMDGITGKNGMNQDAMQGMMQMAAMNGMPPEAMQGMAQMATMNGMSPMGMPGMMAAMASGNIEGVKGKEGQWGSDFVIPGIGGMTPGRMTEQ